MKDGNMRARGRARLYNLLVGAIWFGGLALLTQNVYELSGPGAPEDSVPGRLVRSVAVWTNLLFLGLTLYVFLSRNEKNKTRFLYVFYVLLTVEIPLQILAGLSLLPFLTVKANIPYGRVYCTKEGFSNGRMNRFGWYAPEFRQRSDAHRILIVGDSFVEAMHVERDRNLGARLQDMLDAAPVQDLQRVFGKPLVDVVALGRAGYGPAQYIEMIDYGMDAFDSDEVILVSFMGNDFRNTLPSYQRPLTPERYIYYDWNNQGRFEPVPGSERARDRLRRVLWSNHRPLVFHVVPMLRSRWLTFGVVSNTYQFARLALKRYRHENNQEAGGDGQLSDSFDAGAGGGVFNVDLDEDARRSARIYQTLVEHMQERVESSGQRFRIVSIPYHPPAFYDSGGPGYGALRHNGYDLRQPERLVREVSERRAIPLLELGDTNHMHSLSPDEIKALYLSEGSGHLSEAGHDYVARAMLRAFYPSLDAQ